MTDPHTFPMISTVYDIYANMSSLGESMDRSLFGERRPRLTGEVLTAWEMFNGSDFLWARFELE